MGIIPPPEPIGEPAPKLFIKHGVTRWPEIVGEFEFTCVICDEDAKFHTPIGPMCEKCLVDCEEVL